MNRIKAFLARFRYELCALLWATGLGQVIVYWSVHRPSDPALRALLILLGALCAALLYFTLRKLWRTKWRHALGKVARNLLSKASRWMLKLLEKWNWMGHGSRVLRGKTSVSFDFSTPERVAKKKKKPLKWKQLRTNRERMGFLYRHMLTKRIQSGLEIRPWETPAELKEKTENAPHEEALFNLYLEHRYDERTDRISDDVISELKEAFQIK